MAVPSFVGVAEDRNGNPQGTTSITLPIPSGSDGDLLIAVLGVKENPSTATPAGWTPIIAGFNGCTSGQDPSIGIRAQLSAWWKIAAAGDTQVQFTWGAQVIKQASGAVLRYSGADAANPIGPSNCDKGTSAAPTAPSVTTTSADNRVVRIAVTDADDAKSLFTSEPATKRFEIESTSVFGPGSSYTSEALVTAGSDAPQAAAGPTGTVAWALPSDDQWAAMTFSIQPGTEVPPGCVAALVEIIRRIWQSIIDAINRLFGRRRNRAG